jgi:hypothetical protein
MTTHTQLQSLVRDMVGQRCERTDNPIGSVLSLDFGTLALRLDDEPDALPHGWRHLTVLSPWRLQTPTEVVCDWNAAGGKDGTIRDCIRCLVGHQVLAAAASPPGWDLRVEFANGWTLVVFGDSTDDRQDAWFILGTDGTEAGAVPLLRPAPT